jgi:hypothetical protein
VLLGLGRSTEVSITIVFDPSARWARALGFLLGPFAELFLGRQPRRSLGTLREAAERHRER